jgi:hypothetical protein
MSHDFALPVLADGIELMARTITERPRFSPWLNPNTGNSMMHLAMH